MSWIYGPSELRAAFLRHMKCENVTHKKVPPNLLGRLQRVLKRIQGSSRLEQAQSVLALLVEESRRRGWVTGGSVVGASVGTGPPWSVGGSKAARRQCGCGGAGRRGEAGSAGVS
jgi:hypothetical protein